MGTGTLWYEMWYYAHDHLYSPVFLAGYTGVPVERYEYDAYGNCQIMDASYNPRATSNYANPYLFTGRRLDILDNGSLKLQYNRNRYYDQYTGRWLTHDPLGIMPSVREEIEFAPVTQYDDGDNLYEYVQSHPFLFFDPFGLYKIQWGWRHFNKEEKKKILHSFKRVKDRSDALIAQIEAALESLNKDICKKHCYDSLKEGLLKTKGVLQKTSDGIVSKSEKLELYQKNFGKRKNTVPMRNVKPLWRDYEIHYNTGLKGTKWQKLSDRELDSHHLHELSHCYATEDDDRMGEYMNAYRIMDLVEKDVTRWLVFKYDKMIAERNCKCKTSK